MTRRIGKAAAAAIVLIAVSVGLYLVTRGPGGSTAWAMEQSIAALAGIRTVHIRGTCTEEMFFPRTPGAEPVAFELWARRSEDGKRAGDGRLELASGLTVVLTKEARYIHFAEERVVYVTRQGLELLKPWPDADYLRHVMDNATDVHADYGTDGQTGRPCAFVTCGNPNASKWWWFAFALDTKLLLQLKEWRNPERAGQPAVSIDTIAYNEPLDETMLEFEIPEGAAVLEEGKDSWPALSRLVNDPDAGMSAEGMTREEASARIAGDCWRAVARGDWQRVKRLWPVFRLFGVGMLGKSLPAELVEVGAPYEKPDEVGIGPIVPCTIRFADGKVEVRRMIVMFREIDGRASCVIVGTMTTGPDAGPPTEAPK